MKISKKVWITLFLLPSIAIFTLIYLVPLITVVLSGFSDWNGVDPMKFNGLANYREMFFEDSEFKGAIFNTIKWVLIQSFIHVPFGVLVALVLSKKPFGWRIARSCFMIPNIISTSAMALIFLQIYSPGNGLMNSLIRVLGFKDFDLNWFFDIKTAFLTVTSTWVFYAAVITLISLAELSSISESVIEAARIDGASSTQIDWYINIPLLKNIIGTGMIIAIASTLGNFNMIFLTTGGGPGNLTTNLPIMVFSNLMSANRNGYANALSTIMLILGAGSIFIVTRAFKMNKGVHS
jgi:raffinose/stachyose/melibiose transport system permease protein